MEYAQDERLNIHLDSGPIARWNDMGEQLPPLASRTQEITDEEVYDAYAI